MADSNEQRPVKVIDLMAALRESLERDREANPENYCPDCTHALMFHGARGCTVRRCECGNVWAGRMGLVYAAARAALPTGDDGRTG